LHAFSSDTVIIIKKNVANPQSKPSQPSAKDIDFKKKIAAALNDTNSRVIKKKIDSKFNNSSKSDADPNALSLGNIKVSKLLYGAYADYIIDYVKNYHNNFGPRMGRVKNSNKGYFTLIDNVMRKNNIPKEFHSLAIIESGLNPNAVSPVGAVGPWQFMKPTAELLGLKVDETLDERRDFYKSTHAAAKFCKRLHNIFHDWLLVVAAYNCGPAPVIRNLAKTGGNSYWDIKQYLPKETQNHVMAFIATSLYYDKYSKVLDLGNVPKNAEKLLKKDLGKDALTKKSKSLKEVQKLEDESDLAVAEEEVIDPNAPQFTQQEIGNVLTLKVKGAYNLETIAEILDCEIKQLRRWNPKFNEDAYAKLGQVKLTIPTSKLDAFLIQKEKILSVSIKNPHPISVEAPKLAPNMIAKFNNQKPESVKPTNNIIVAKTTEKTLPTVEKKVNNKTLDASKTTLIENKLGAKKTAEKKTYQIKVGDNLNKIAEAFGMTVARLMELNQLKKPVLIPGHTLYLE
jgi:membrane-bound lytic murein transglycosylase D